MVCNTNLIAHIDFLKTFLQYGIPLFTNYPRGSDLAKISHSANQLIPLKAGHNYFLAINFLPAV